MVSPSMWLRTFGQLLSVLHETFFLISRAICYLLNTTYM